MSSAPPPLQNTPSKQQYYYFFIVGMAVIALFLLLTNSYAVRCCLWIRRVVTGREAVPSPTPPPGLSVQQWIPAHKYMKQGDDADGECPVCLSAFADGEEVRELPQCGHAFHVACIDMWFHSHTSCPVCRSVVLPTPSESAEMPAHGTHSRENLLGHRMMGGGLISIV